VIRGVKLVDGRKFHIGGSMAESPSKLSFNKIPDNGPQRRRELAVSQPTGARAVEVEGGTVGDNQLKSLASLLTEIDRALTIRG
jgi:hypothetical protein